MVHQEVSKDQCPSPNLHLINDQICERREGILEAIGKKEIGE